MPPVEGEKGFPVITTIAGWIDLEDEVLRRAHQKHGDEGKKWAKISGYFIQKERDQCKNRWYKALNPAVKRAKQEGSGPSSTEKGIDLNFKELVSKSSLVTKVRIIAFHTKHLNSLSKPFIVICNSVL